ncbi:NADPH oxidase organizer 1a [Chanos chanos]|uniref:NADPH oxidase organizer 1a n=1 Tax=Chanos chanos TaxID=29144 RepID=A0A6J2WQN3_CHACN|nr:NADPH oxidase organizer 1 [Chanos chanos]
MEDQRFPLNVRLLGVMHKETNKLYMTSVLWSDQNEIVVYRSFEEFEDMHRQLKKKFQASGTLRKSDRVIPKFKIAKGKSNAQKKTPSKSVLRLKTLEQYCNELLSCDPRVPQNSDLIQFFLPKDQDLKPEFARNSIVIMPSEDTVESTVGGGSDGGVTQPFVTETYRCIAPYETKDTKNRPFKVDVDETVDVLIKDKGGWWLVENEAKCLAWFPAPYLEKPEEDSLDSDPETNYDESTLYVASRSYKATSRDELSVEIGSVVEVLQKSENGWWLIRYNVKTGYVPAMYLQPYSHPRVRMAPKQNNRQSPNLSLAQLQVPARGSSQLPSNTLSRSQGNLLQLPGLNPADKLRSRSTDVLSDVQPSSSIYQVPVTISVETDVDGRERSMSNGSYGSEFSDFSDESTSSGGDSLNLSHSYKEEQLRRSRTPPPMVTGRLHPESAAAGKLTPSSSDPNLFKIPTTPKVPPRPRAQEILQRCTTITRKNALNTKNQLVPQLETITSH